VKVSDQISAVELSQPLEYSKNEAFALLEIYDLKTLNKIYSQKASSEVSIDGKSYNTGYYGENNTVNADRNKEKGPHFNYSARSLAVRNLNKILKDIEQKAIK